MQSKFNLSSLAPADFGVNSSFNVVVAYEDFETGKQAKKVCDFLSDNLGTDCKVSQQMWKFDVLDISNLRDMAAKDGAQADIIIVASHGSNRLPAAFKEWAEQWLAEKPHAIALVALFASPNDHPEVCQQSRAYLSQVATRGKMEFFAQPEFLPGWKSETHARPQFPTTDRTLSTIAGLMDNDVSFPRWGINE